MSEWGMLSIGMSVLSICILIWSSIRTRQYKKWNDAMNEVTK